MSDLQLSLLAIGAVVVAAVYFYNWWQERRLRRRLQAAFGEERDDALMKPVAAEPLARAEPQLRVEPELDRAYADEAEPARAPYASPAAELEDAPAAVQDEAEVPPVPWFDEALDYVAQILAPAPISAAAIAELLSKIAGSGKPCRAAGFDEAAGEWQELARTGGGHHRRVALALQLVTRSGPLAAPQLAAFTDAVRAAATKLGAVADYPDSHEALSRARALDEFCAEVDVAIGVNVVAAPGASFNGDDIRTQAEAAGLKLEPDGLFHYRRESRHTLFTLDNHEPLPFIPEQMATLSTGGVTLLLDVPRVADGARALEVMVDTAERLAKGLGGRMVDDNRVPLNAAGIGKIREQLDGIAAAMAAQGIAPGGERALRLFS